MKREPLSLLAEMLFDQLANDRALRPTRRLGPAFQQLDVPAIELDCNGLHVSMVLPSWHGVNTDAQRKVQKPASAWRHASTALCPRVDAMLDEGHFGSATGEASASIAASSDAAN